MPSDNVIRIASTVDWTSLGMLFTTIVLAFLTGAYVVLTRKLVQAQAEPCVIVFTRHDEARPTIIQLIIKNIGNSLARDIQFDLPSNLPEKAFGIVEAQAKDANTMTDGPLINGIPALAPGEERRITWGQYGGLKKALGNNNINVVSRFKFGDKEMSPVTCVLEIRSFEGTEAHDPDGARQSASELKKIADILQHSSSGFRPLKIEIKNDKASNEAEQQAEADGSPVGLRECPQLSLSVSQTI